MRSDGLAKGTHTHTHTIDPSIHPIFNFFGGSSFFRSPFPVRMSQTIIRFISSDWISEKEIIRRLMASCACGRPHGESQLVKRINRLDISTYMRSIMTNPTSKNPYDSSLRLSGHWRSRTCMQSAFSMSEILLTYERGHLLIAKSERFFEFCYRFRSASCASFGIRLRNGINYWLFLHSFRCWHYNEQQQPEHR